MSSEEPFTLLALTVIGIILGSIFTTFIIIDTPQTKEYNYNQCVKRTGNTVANTEWCFNTFRPKLDL